MTYSELIKNNGASTTVRALEQRARRMARSRNRYLHKFSQRCRSWDVRGEYYLGVVYGPQSPEIFPTIEAVIDYLAEQEIGDAK